MKLEARLAKLEKMRPQQSNPLMVVGRSGENADELEKRWFGEHPEDRDRSPQLWVILSKGGQG